MTEDKPFNSRSILIRRKDISSQYSHYRNFSPVAYKLNRAFIDCDQLEDYRIYYKRRFYYVQSEENYNEFMENPDSAISVKPDFCKLPIEMDIGDAAKLKDPKDWENKGYCPVELYMNNLVFGKPHLNLKYNGKHYCFENVRNYKIFKKHPYVFEALALPSKLPVIPNPKADSHAHKHGDIMAYLENYLSKILGNVLNYLAKIRIKYPKISGKETTLKLLSICLKTTNPNKPDAFRQKYADKMKLFIRHCMVSNELMTEANRRKKELAYPEEDRDWTEADEENFLQLAEEYEELIKTMDSNDKRKYFQRFIR